MYLQVLLFFFSCARDIILAAVTGVGFQGELLSHTVWLNAARIPIQGSSGRSGTRIDHPVGG